MPLPIDPVTGLQNASLAPAKKASGQDMSSVDFMKLIIAQMRNQNPLEPQKDSDFMAQMAQFEALNQMKAVAEGMKVLQAVNELSSAAGMLGKNVIGRQVDALPVLRDMVARERYTLPYADLASQQKAEVNRDPRVQEAAFDIENAGREVTGTVDRVIVGPDGIPMLFVMGKVVDMFSVSEVSGQ
jgi:flagellar hook assembly protein FlgD